MKFVSDRGHELFFCSTGCGDRPVITVEYYIKWYTLFVVHHDGRVTELDYQPDLEDEFISRYGESAYGDHVFNPRFVVFLADRLEMDVDEIALEVIIGRWQQEHCNVNFSLPAPNNAIAVKEESPPAATAR
jgi:hypothetical protein